MVKEGAGRQAPGVVDEDSASTSDVSSEEEEYIECECGESVVLKEFESHTELHRHEDMALHGDGEKTASLTAAHRSPLRAGHASFSGTDRAPTIPLSDIGSSQDGYPKADTVNKHRSRNTDTKQRQGVNKWKDMLLGTSLSTARSKTGKDRHKMVRRLGVCLRQLPKHSNC